MSKDQTELNHVVKTRARTAVNGIPVYRVRCPYCSNVNTFHWEGKVSIFGQQESRVLKCSTDFKDHDYGEMTIYQGCGRSYAFTPSIEISGTARKIEGES